MIEGIPDGWEPVRFDHASYGDAYLGGDGEILRHLSPRPTLAKRLIVRKIEKPKRYRPFNDPTEAEQLLGFPLRLKVDYKNMRMFIGITTDGFQIGLSHWKPKEAFDCFERLDGTPFGIEVTE